MNKGIRRDYTFLLLYLDESRKMDGNGMESRKIDGL